MCTTVTHVKFNKKYIFKFLLAQFRVLCKSIVWNYFQETVSKFYNFSFNSTLLSLKTSLGFKFNLNKKKIKYNNIDKFCFLMT